MRVMKRDQLPIHRWMMICQKLPNEYESQVIKFRRFEVWSQEGSLVQPLPNRKWLSYSWSFASKNHDTTMTDSIVEGPDNFDRPGPSKMHRHRTAHGPQHFASTEMQPPRLGFQIGNADQTLVWLDAPESTTVDFKGAQSVSVRTTGTEYQGSTVM